MQNSFPIQSLLLSLSLRSHLPFVCTVLCVNLWVFSFVPVIRALLVSIQSSISLAMHILWEVWRAAANVPPAVVDQVEWRQILLLNVQTLTTGSIAVSNKHCWRQNQRLWPFILCQFFGPIVGGLRPIFPLPLMQSYQTWFQSQMLFSVSRDSSVIKDQACLDTGNSSITPERRKFWREDMKVGRRGLLEVEWVNINGDIRRV